MVVVNPAWAATTFKVTTTADSGSGSLREAINAANAPDSGEDRITFDIPSSDPGCSEDGCTIKLVSQLSITDASGLTIDGGSASITVSGEGQTRVFSVFSGNTKPSATLKNLTVADGFVFGSSIGGGIFNGGTLEVADSTFSGNSSPLGGGITNDGTLTVTNSTFSGNSSDQGGGIGNIRGALTVINSTFSGNSAIQGSGIWSGPENLGALTVTNSTISQNIMHPHDQAHGGGIASTNGGSLKNTIVANNSGENCIGTLTDGGYNIDDGTTCGFSTNNNSQPSTKPLLDPDGLKDNGGPTKTIALQEGSPAIDQGNSFGSTTDQRGEGRPQDDPAIQSAPDGDGSDIGAFELDTTAPTVSSVTPTSGKTGVSRTTPNITATFSEPVDKATAEAIDPTTQKSVNVKLINTANGKQVAATVSCDSDPCNKVTITPNSALGPNTKYTAMVTTGVEDLAGNALLDQNPTKKGNQPKTWTFTTGR